MVNVTIENRLPELEEIYFRFETMKIPPEPLIEIEIKFKNSKIAILKRNSTININGYECYIDGVYFDLREDIIKNVLYKV